MFVNVNYNEGFNTNKVSYWNFDNEQCKFYIWFNDTKIEPTIFIDEDAIQLYYLFTGKFDKFNIRNKFTINLQDDLFQIENYF